MKSASEFIHVESPQMAGVARLASEAVISNSLLTIKGPQGSGKTHAVQMLERMVSNRLGGETDKAKTFPWRVIFFHCAANCEPKIRFESLIRAINPRHKIPNIRVPYLVETLATVLAQGDPLLLYLDNAHSLDRGERLGIQEAVQFARRTHQIGLAMSVLDNSTGFERIIYDARSLAEVRLERLEPDQVLCSIRYYDRRFEPWFQAYTANDREAQAMSKVLADHVRETFARVVALCDSLRHHSLEDHLTLAEVRRVIALRSV